MTDDVKDYPADTLANIYIKVRDKRAEIKQAYEEKDAELRSQLDILSAEMLEICKENGADSIRTNAGTIIRKVDTRYWTSDWDSMYKVIAEHNAFALFEKRLSQANVRQFLEENPDVHPAGLQSDSRYTIIVRRSSK